MNNKNGLFQFFSHYFMEPMGKISQFRIVRGIMVAGMTTIPFTIVGSMFLIVSVLPQTFSVLDELWSQSFDKIQNLYMLGNMATMGALALYFCLVFGYEYTKIQAQEEKITVNPLNGALLSMMAFFMCLPELIVENGSVSLVNIISDQQTVIEGWEIASGVTRLGTAGIFTAIIMSIIAVKIYTVCVKRQWVIKMPPTVPTGVANSFTALIPTVLTALSVILVNGILIMLKTDIFKMIAIPFAFVTNLTNTWIGLLVIYFLIHALWIVGIHGATIVTSFLTPIVLSNMVKNQSGATFPFAGEFNNSFVTIGGSGATLGMVIFITFFGQSTQLSALGKAAIIPSLFNINETVIFGLPIVYNPYTAIPFFLAPMSSMSVAYFAIKWGFAHPPIALSPWPIPVGLSAFIGSSGDWRAFILAIFCALVAFFIWFPFIKFYDGQLYQEEQLKATSIS